MSKRQCAMRDCPEPGTKTCTGCGVVGYCSKEHQRDDWKTHKLTCKQQHKLPAGRGEEIPVTWEDQQRINIFSRLTIQLSKIEDDLKTKNNELLNLTDASEEVDQLLDDDACKIRVGEVYVSVSNEEAEEFVKAKQQATKQAVEKLKQQQKNIEEELSKLKSVLYAKFGNQINLENADQERRQN